MSALRALNLAQHWLTREADEETRQRVRALMSGPLETTITAKKSDDGRRRPPVPWWWGNDEDASRDTLTAMTALRKR